MDVFFSVTTQGRTNVLTEWLGKQVSCPTSIYGAPHPDAVHRQSAL